MKKCFVFVFFIFSAAFAFAAPDMYAHLNTYDEMEKTFFEKLVSGKEATYKICTKEDSSKQYLKDEKANEIFLESVDNWLRRTRRYISKNKAEKEFSDILSIVNRRPNLRKIPCMDQEYADLTIRYTKDYSICGDGAGGCIDLSSGKIFVNVAWLRDYVEILTHELGHAFGLADQYSGAIYRGSFIYNSKVLRPSIMNNSKNVTCDDVDGFITSIDRLKGTSREFYSLCKDGLFIQNGQGVIKADRTYDFAENYDNFNVKINVYYDTELEESYTMDMTLRKFIINENGIDLLRKMGFDVSSLNTVRHAVVKIHGTVKEKFSLEEFNDQHKTPVGLWTLVLYEQLGLSLKEKQIVTKDFFDEDVTVKLENVETSEMFFSIDPIKIPLVDLFHDVGIGEKEALRVKNMFRADLDRRVNRMQNIGFSNKNVEALTPTDIGSIPVIDLGQ